MPSSAPSITTSKSTLMHACLASVSPEILTLDSIIRATPRVSLPHKVALPTEILLLIREWLFPDITRILIQHSTAALEAYEHSLRNLLCPDCIAYNLDIFGPNIWHWEHFNGPCACLEVDNISCVGHGPHNPQNLKAATSLPPMPNPNEYMNAQEWLESHLSREAVSRLKSQSPRIPRMTPTLQFPQIWELVSLILEEFGCHFLPDPEDPGEGKPIPAGPESHPPRRHDLVQVISSTTTSTLSTGSECYVRDPTLLHRAARDLCLEWTEPFGIHDRDTSSFKGQLWRPNRGEAHQDREQVQLLFSVLAAGAAACLSLPITFTTVAITIVCFYSKPRSFRII
ncbi:hypothetical protein CPB83DRAFT_847948 [Crepidotus variabilis]|uniref:Uncharacterized protein n=1 Tax=Crepidotus variabilis TaxID=179855 RepID=A0A9P6EN22_9AGAR|nr:hypothetical protein CPB83DRAFT_847948 [Crepidotus variabilis]